MEHSSFHFLSSSVHFFFFFQPHFNSFFVFFFHLMFLVEHRETWMDCWRILLGAVVWFDAVCFCALTLPTSTLLSHSLSSLFSTRSSSVILSLCFIYSFSKSPTSLHLHSLSDGIIVYMAPSDLFPGCKDCICDLPPRGLNQKQILRVCKLPDHERKGIK